LTDDIISEEPAAFSPG